MLRVGRQTAGGGQSRCDLMSMAEGVPRVHVAVQCARVFNVVVL